MRFSTVSALAAVIISPFAYAAPTAAPADGVPPKHQVKDLYVGYLEDLQGGPHNYWAVATDDYTCRHYPYLMPSGCAVGSISGTMCDPGNLNVLAGLDPFHFVGCPPYNQPYDGWWPTGVTMGGDLVMKCEGLERPPADLICARGEGKTLPQGPEKGHVVLRCSASSL